ncbi:hypothetical protein AMAG_17872 [Allomyces macrogynus ATCC 38327]|uniref:Uncharacterized protein n=1 Tax=Allomyces macrogynus (strain ATCC 38327) TaxID=578462 RepID=A0A0L0S0N9_ALLM3|nr:hypothetical protein AMAG_17872 [Allomyces macrogynus ATCC 38327]|eukprot:KNE56123.1 hypothetical protein AMAG_17872 [Allomyces macrogynus ATCC 38327]
MPPPPLLEQSGPCATGITPVTRLTESAATSLVQGESQFALVNLQKLLITVTDYDLIWSHAPLLDATRNDLSIRIHRVAEAHVLHHTIGSPVPLLAIDLVKTALTELFNAKTQPALDAHRPATPAPDVYMVDLSPPTPPASDVADFDDDPTLGSTLTPRGSWPPPVPLLGEDACQVLLEQQQLLEQILWPPPSLSSGTSASAVSPTASSVALSLTARSIAPGNSNGHDATPPRNMSVPVHPQADISPALTLPSHGPSPVSPMPQLPHAPAVLAAQQETSQPRSTTISSSALSTQSHASWPDAPAGHGGPDPAVVPSPPAPPTATFVDPVPYKQVLARGVWFADSPDWSRLDARVDAVDTQADDVHFDLFTQPYRNYHASRHASEESLSDHISFGNETDGTSDDDERLMDVAEPRPRANPPSNLVCPPMRNFLPAALELSNPHNRLWPNKTRHHAWTRRVRRRVLGR